MSLPQDILVEGIGTEMSLEIGIATAVDEVWTSEEIIITNDAPTAFPLGTTEVTWTAQNERGGIGVEIQKVTVQDTTPPVVIPPSDLLLEAIGSLTPFPIGTATATDLVSESEDITISNDAPAEFPLGTTIVSWTAIDKEGNTANANQTVKVQDTTPPSISLPKSVTIEATGPETAFTIDEATASDQVTAEEDILITSDQPDAFSLGATLVTWTAEDEAGNTATSTHTITVEDTSPPIVLPPPDISVETAGENVALDIGQAFAIDLVDRNPCCSPSPDFTGPFKEGVNTVTWSATDSSGNTGTATQLVTVSKVLLSNRPSVIAPYWQADENAYTFISVSHPSLSGMNEEIGLSFAIQSEEGEGSGVSNDVAADSRVLIEFDIKANETKKVFIVGNGTGHVNEETLSPGNFVIGLTDTHFGSLEISPLSPNPQSCETVAVNHCGFPDIRQLNLWGVIVIPQTNTGFAMEFIGDINDSRAFNTPNFSGVN